MKVGFPNAWFGRSVFSTEHAASSYGIPVLLDERGTAYGAGDSVRDDPLGWMEPEIRTAGDVVRRFLPQWDERTSQGRAIHAAARLFLQAAGQPE